jgi:DedD protein
MGLFSFLGKKKQDSEDDLDIPVRPRRSRAKANEDEPMDPMLPEKKRARRRLIGATALVLAAIIGLPMIFDSEPKPLSNDIAIQIPPRDKTPAINTSPMPLPPAPVVEDTPKADAPADKNSEPAADAVSNPAASKAAAAKPAADKPVEPRIDALVDKAPANKEEKKTDTAKSADKDKSRFIVQVAAVTNKAKVDELLNRLKKDGINGYWQKVSTKDGDRFRVRVGPFGSREEAEKMSRRIGKLGLTGAVQSI